MDLGAAELSNWEQSGVESLIRDVDARQCTMFDGRLFMSDVAQFLFQVASVAR
jgi:hypothetical protein